MDITTIAQLIGSLGFPIIACVACAWFVKYTMDKNNEEVASMRKEHTEEINKVTEALNNNTLAIQKLIDRIGGNDGRI